MERLAAIVLAAGAGNRLRPLTDLRPKALCPVDNVPLVDRSIDRAQRHTAKVSVNAHHGSGQIEEHLRGRVNLSIEERQALGTAGALGNLLEWIAGDDVLVINADAWHDDLLDELAHGWQRDRIRLLVVPDLTRGDFGQMRFAGASLMPWKAISMLAPSPSGLYERVWRPWLDEGRLDLIESREPFFDCGTPAEYHAANMYASGGQTVVGKGAVVEGIAERCVLWPGVTVRTEEHLRDAIRASSTITVTV